MTTKRSGGYRLEGDLTGEVGAGLAALLSPLAKPRPADAEPDDRDYGQRLHDALQDVVARLLRGGDLPISGGTPATVIVHVDLADLIKQCGFGETTDGTLLPVQTVLKMASEADIIPVAFAKTGVPLSLGRDRRVANKNQTLALIARDGGCSFPGCTHPAEWCERHHLLSWLRNGRTDVINLTLLCGYHHRMFEQRGWTCEMLNGFPAWIPPKWIDREQKPIIHHRIRQRHKINSEGRRLDC